MAPWRERSHTSPPQFALAAGFNMLCLAGALLVCRYTLHIIDTDPTSASAGGWLEDTSLVQKYTMSDDDYNQRENTYRCDREIERTSSSRLKGPCLRRAGSCGKGWG